MFIFTLHEDHRRNFCILYLNQGKLQNNKQKNLLTYASLLNSDTSSKWLKIGLQRRAGVCVPLFSIYTSESVGIGELPDLRSVIDWCKLTGMSILQLLPINETGADNAPYNSISTFAIDPVYLSIKKLRKVDIAPFRNELRLLKKKYKINSTRVDYNVRKDKIELLRKIFDATDINSNEQFQIYVNKNIRWLKFYTLFKILSKKHSYKGWEDWDFKYKYIPSITAEKILSSNEQERNFYFWLQWQLFEQLCAVKKYAERQSILIMGDLPFLVSRNSSDVWAYKNYFKLDLSSGAPPDMYFSQGQRWGMPPYNWDNIAADKYSYIIERLRYAENFYDMFRIDHFIGLFRVWTIDLKTPQKMGGLEGKFDPPDDHLWEDHGRNILKVINENSKMLPCAEDLGTVPDAAVKVLKEFGVPGINVQRWEKKWNGHFEFLPTEDYRINSVATVSTHDSSTLPAWWENEAGTIDRLLFKQTCDKYHISEIRCNELIDLLFDKRFSGSDRLYWKEEISNVYVLLEVLKLDFYRAEEFVKMYLASYGEKIKFRRFIDLTGPLREDATPDFVRASIESVSKSASIFSIQLIYEYLYLDKNFLKMFKSPDYRVNMPGIVDDNNWKIRLPFGMKVLKEMEINKDILKINKNSGRVLSSLYATIP